MPSEREERLYWETQVSELSRSGLKNIRETAGKWQTTIGSLLGIFTAVAFVKGPSTFEDLGASAAQANALVALLFVSAAVAFAATLVTALAAQGIPGTKVRSVTGLELAAWMRTESIRAAEMLQAARWMTIGAAALVLAGSFITLWVALTAPSDGSVWALVRRADGQVLCGSLRGPQALRLEAGGLEVQLTSADEIEIVERCPK